MPWGDHFYANTDGTNPAEGYHGLSFTGVWLSCVNDDNSIYNHGSILVISTRF